MMWIALIQRTIRLGLSDTRDHLLNMRDRRFLPDTVTQVENMPGAAEIGEHIIHCLIQSFSTGDQHRRIEISLDRAIIPELHNSLLPIRTPVETDHIRVGDFGNFRRRCPIDVPFGKTIIFASGIACRTLATIRPTGSTHQRSNASPANAPAQVSKICTTSAPELICPIKCAAEASISRSMIF